MKGIDAWASAYADSFTLNGEEWGMLKQLGEVLQVCILSCPPYFILIIA
jgi:hypothetical protein